MLSKSSPNRYFPIFMLLCAAILILSYLLLIGWKESDRRKNLDSYLSTSIPNDVARDLCSRNLLPNHIVPCTSEIQITRREMFEIFESQVSPQDTYEEVHTKFGIYEERCDRTFAGSYRCSYFFKTSPRILVEYSNEGVVNSIRSELIFN